MEHENYTINEVIRRMDAQDGVLVDIKTQTMKTNGRVGKLENFKSFMTGGLAVISIILIPILIFIVELYITSKSTTSQPTSVLQSQVFQSKQ